MTDDESVVETYSIAIPKSGLGITRSGREIYSADVTIAEIATSPSTSDRYELFDPRTKLHSNKPYSGEVVIAPSPWIDAAETEECSYIPDSSPPHEDDQKEGRDSDEKSGKNGGKEDFGSKELDSDSKSERYGHKHTDIDSDDSFSK